MCIAPAPNVISDGRALPHTGLVSLDFVVGTVNSTLLFVTNTGDSGTVGVVMNVSPAGAYVDGLQMFTVPTLAAEDAAGGASASRAMKISLAVTNCSNSLKRGGRVTYLNSSQRLPMMSSSSLDTIITAIKSSPYRRRITGDILRTPTHLIGYPVDNVAYGTFRPHRGTLTHAQFGQYIYGAGGTDGPLPRPMSVICYVFDPTGDPQDYSATVRTSMYTRWPLTSIPGHSMKNMPTATAALINHVRDHAESTANDLAHIVEGGVMATVAPKLAGMARSAANRVISGMTAGDAFAVDALGAEGASALEMAAMVAGAPIGL